MVGGWPPVGGVPSDGGGPPVGGVGPVGGGDEPGGSVPAPDSIRPKSAAVRRILKKYMATIANANAMSSAIVRR